MDITKLLVGDDVICCVGFSLAFSILLARSEPALIKCLLNWSATSALLVYILLFLTILSDHSMDFNCRAHWTGCLMGRNTVTSRNCRKLDSQSFRNDISSQSWENVYAFSNPDAMWQEWKHTFFFLAIANKHAPLRTKPDRARVYSLRHRKCGVQGYIHHLFVSRPGRAR